MNPEDLCAHVGASKVIEVKNEEHRGQIERRALHSYLARERKYQVLQAAASIYGANHIGIVDSVTTAIALLEEIEKRESFKE
jgi:hypothetical protein